MVTSAPNIKKMLIVVWVIFRFSFCAYSQGEFKFDREIVLKCALLGFEEFKHHNPNDKDDIKEYDIKNPTFYSRYLLDCDKKKVKIILVAFPHLKTSGTASIYIRLDNDDYFD